ncbi:hypothetical protein [Kitasatospora nipponensis]|uniref:hypothetical protein n=1 Tax=Kitasatospora nipponensis TaxID=258049 RepID=UPI0031D1D13E
MLVGVLLAGAAVTAVWWKPWQQSVRLPQSACWGTLGPDDYRVLAGRDGTATLRTDYTISGPYPGDNPNRECFLVWNDGRKAMLDVRIVSSPDASEVEAFGGRPATSVDFGADGRGWISSGDGPVGVYLYLTCDYRQVASKRETADPGFAIRAATNPALSAAPIGEVRQALVGITLKLAKGVARQMPCANSPRLVDRPPQL